MLPLKLHSQPLKEDEERALRDWLAKPQRDVLLRIVRSRCAKLALDVAKLTCNQQEELAGAQAALRDLATFERTLEDITKLDSVLEIHSIVIQ